MNSTVSIPLSEIIHHPLSFADPNGRLFWWNGDLYRAIGEARAAFYRDLFDQGVIQNLIEKELLVETELTDFSLGDFPLVLKHEALPFVTYAHEWCAEMLKDAGRCVLEMQECLRCNRLMLHDAHPWNVVFDGTRPRYVDFGSIIPESDASWPAAAEFKKQFLRPLRMMGAGAGRAARWLIHDLGYDTIDDAELAKMFPTHINGRNTFGLIKAAMVGASRAMPAQLKRPIRKALLAVVSRPNDGNAQEGATALLDELERIAIPTKTTEWSHYYDSEFPAFIPTDVWTEKHRTFQTILDRLKPDTMLDVGSNRGWYSQLAARSGVTVIAIDTDEPSVTKLYCDARADQLPLQPLIMDIRNPSPGYGLCNEWFAPATARLKCDVVVALALVHHLVFKHSLHFEPIIRALATFSKRALVIEFIDREDQYVREWWSENYSWYKVAQFRQTLGQYFNTIDEFPSNSMHRKIFLCTR